MITLACFIFLYINILIILNLVHLLFLTPARKFNSFGKSAIQLNRCLYSQIEIYYQLPYFGLNTV